MIFGSLQEHKNIDFDREVSLKLNSDVTSKTRDAVTLFFDFGVQHLSRISEN